MVRPQGFRERLDELERASLSTWAIVSSEAKGRDHHEDPDPLRTAFQVDVHRILRSDAFNALAGKSAWLPAGSGASRLALTLEVARLADTLGRALRLNADLTQAVALGYGLGAAPFADAGEVALGHFGHDMTEQCVRIVERLEGGGAGLNLTWETRDGMLTAAGHGQPATAEGQVVQLAVSIARTTQHPAAADAVRDGAVQVRLGTEPRAWGDALVADAAEASADRPDMRLSEAGQAALDALHRVVEDARWAGAGAVTDYNRAVHCVQSLAIYMLQHGAAATDASARQRVVDHLSGRTERELIAAYRAHFEPPS